MDQNSNTSFKARGELLATVLFSVLALALVGAIVFRIGFVTFVEQHELPYTYDRRTGEVSVLPHTGYIIHLPFMVQVHGIDLRPHQVLLTVGGGGPRGSSANYRVLNAKLVQFKAEGLQEFIRLHGLQEGDVSEILKIYAYDQEGRSYPFLKVEAQTSGMALAPVSAPR